MADLMTLAEAAQYLKLSQTTVYNKVRRGEIPATKKGWRWQLLKDELDKWLSRNGTNKKKLESKGIKVPKTGRKILHEPIRLKGKSLSQIIIENRQ